MSITAFQSDAFQVDAFQIFTGSVGAGRAVRVHVADTVRRSVSVSAQSRYKHFSTKGAATYFSAQPRILATKKTAKTTTKPH
jgi:hypothetical protein